MYSNFNLPNHAEKKVETVSKRDSQELVRFPGFNKCKDPVLHMEFRRELEVINAYMATTPFTGLIDHAGTETGKRIMREQLKRKYAPDLKEILTCHPVWIKEMGMTPKQVEEFKPEDVSPVDVVDVPGDYRARK